jgi:acyl carrier protein
MKPDSAIVKAKVKEYILQAASAEKEKIKDDSLIFKEGFFDSMGFVMLISFLEQEFGTRTSDADLVEENFESINAITAFVDRKAQ